jgi:hypothetical protein
MRETPASAATSRIVTLAVATDPLRSEGLLDEGLRAMPRNLAALLPHEPVVHRRSAGFHGWSRAWVTLTFMPDVAKEVRIVRAHHRRIAVASAVLSVTAILCGCGGQEFASAPVGRAVDREDAQSADANRSSAAGSAVQAVLAPPSVPSQ